MKGFLSLIFAFTLFLPAIGQERTPAPELVQQDTALIASYAKRYNPRKALLFAAVVPGLGQIYNKKYWKLPLVYGGMYLLAKEGIDYYNDYYREYRGYLFYNLENGLGADAAINPQTKLTTINLRRIVDKVQRERDLCIIIMAGIYILQMVDAHVDAHLKEFDLNPNLQVKLEPMLEQNALAGRQTGVSLVFRF